MPMKSINQHIPGTISRKLVLLRRLNRTLIECLPIEYIAHVQAVGYEYGTLKLVAESPVWASKVRYQTNDIIHLLNSKTDMPVSRIEVSVHPKSVPIPSKAGKKPHLSKNSAQLCKTLANALHDPELKQALNKLSKRAPG